MHATHNDCNEVFQSILSFPHFNVKDKNNFTYTAFIVASLHAHHETV